MLRTNGAAHIYIVIGLVALTLSISLETLAMSQNGTLKQSRALKTIPSSVSGGLSASYSQDLIDKQDGSNFYSGNLMGRLTYSHKEIWSLKSSLGYYNNFKDAEKSSNGISDLGLSLKLLSLNDLKYFSQTVTVFSDLPLSKESRDVDNLYTSLGGKYSISSLSFWLIPGFSFYLSLSLNKNFHQFETDKSGAILTSHSLKEGTGVSYEKGRFILELDVSHSHRFNYENRVSEGISHSQEISYDVIPDQWSATIGHSNEGPWFKENGEELNLEAVSDDNSVLYLQTSVSF